MVLWSLKWIGVMSMRCPQHMFADTRHMEVVLLRLA